MHESYGNLVGLRASVICRLRGTYGQFFFLNINHVYLHNFMKWSILCKIMAMVVKDCRTEVLLALGDFGSSFKNWKAEYCLALDGSRALSQNFDINTAIHQVSMSAW